MTMLILTYHLGIPRLLSKHHKPFLKLILVLYNDPVIHLILLNVLLLYHLNLYLLNVLSSLIAFLLNVISISSFLCDGSANVISIGTTSFSGKFIGPATRLSNSSPVNSSE